MALTEAERLAQALEHFCTNWDGSARHDRKTPLNGLLCCDLRQAAAELRRLSADAQRYAWLKSNARQNTAHDVFGNGGHWGIGFFSEDNRQGFDAAIDQAMKDTP